MNRKLSLAPSLALLLMAACAHTPPVELIEARQAYERAAEGPAKEYTPAGLHVAKNSLMTAERSYRNKEDDWLVRGQSYIAMRKAELAEAQARTEMHQRDAAAAKMREDQLKDEIMKRTKAELEGVKQQLDANRAAGAMTEQQLAAERERRAEAERRAASAMSELQRLGSVKQDPRGVVVTLSGSVLFASGHAELLPDAKTKLNDVADALLEGDPDATFVVEGHTDSQGKSDKNQTLSLARANAVRDYLIGREIAADRITAEGHGESHPVASNATPEGRANNRRVEIVIKPGKHM